MINHVPTLATCQKLKSAGFPQETYFYYIQFTRDGEWYTFHRSHRAVEDHKAFSVAAPLLTEILEQLPDQTQLYKGKGRFIFRRIANSTKRESYDSDNPAEAAALLWLELNQKD